jgi:hypothetical protein
MPNCSAPLAEPRTTQGLLTWLCALLDGERVTFRGEVYRVVSGALFRERGDGSLVNAPELSVQVLINAIIPTKEPFCQESAPPPTARSRPSEAEAQGLIQAARARANSWTLPRYYALRLFEDAYTGAQVGEKGRAEIADLLHQTAQTALAYYPSAREVRAIVEAAFARYEATRG